MTFKIVGLTDTLHPVKTKSAPKSPSDRMNKWEREYARSSSSNADRGRDPLVRLRVAQSCGSRTTRTTRPTSWSCCRTAGLAHEVKVIGVTTLA